MMRSLLLIVTAGAAAFLHPARSPANSEPREVNVIGLDYAFQHPTELPAGPTIFRFVNKGKVRHEFNIALLKQGVKPGDVVALRKEGKSPVHLLEGGVGVLFASPGGSSGAALSTN